MPALGVDETCRYRTSCWLPSGAIVIDEWLWLYAETNKADSRSCRCSHTRTGVGHRNLVELAHCSWLLLGFRFVFTGLLHSTARGYCLDSRPFLRGLCRKQAYAS